MPNANEACERAFKFLSDIPKKSERLSTVFGELQINVIEVLAAQRYDQPNPLLQPLSRAGSATSLSNGIPRAQPASAKPSGLAEPGGKIAYP